MKKSSYRSLLFFRRGVLVAALLVICGPTIANATDRKRAPVNKTGLHSGADPVRRVFARNYVKLPFEQTDWIDGTGDWFSASNWSAGIPDSGTIAQINNGGTAQIASGIAAASQIELGIAVGDVGTLSISGFGSLQDEGTMYVGEQGIGTVSITAGTSVSSFTFVLGQIPGSNGTATVSGPGSTWTNFNFCFVGADGTGTLNITNGGTVIASDTGVGAGVGSGVVVIDGVGSTWSHGGTIVVGGNANGVGTVTVSNGGTIFTDGGGGSFGSVIGYNSGSTGTVNIIGVGSSWTNKGVLSISDVGGNGILHVMTGGSVSNSSGIVGNFGGTAEVTVEGTGSTWTNNGDLIVGNNFDGVGLVTISDGARVSNFNGFVGFNSSANGTVEVDGTGSTWANSGDLYVGGSNSGAAGIGVVHVADGGSVSAASVTVWQSGTLSGSGSLQVTNGTTIEGILVPEQTLSIVGDVTFGGTAGTLSTVTPGEADNVVVEGMANLNGDFDVTLTGGPFIVGTQYTLLQANSGLNGTTFSNVLISAPPGVDAQVTYDTNHVYLVIKPSGTPTPTPTGTPSSTPTPTPTPTPCTGRCTPTPRPRPTPHPRP
jgi:T5SS/PEP-CTERM-associated repeat protein